MTTNYHTPHAVGFRLNASEFNAIYSDLDAQITAVSNGTFTNVTVTNTLSHTGDFIRFFNNADVSPKLSITGNVTTGTLSDLQQVVDLLLDALDNYGLIGDSTT